MRNVADLRGYFDNLIVDQYQRLEFAYAKQVFWLLENQRISELIKLDDQFAAMQHYEFAQASENMGHNYLKHINFDIEEPSVAEYFSAVKSQNAIGNELSILSAYAYELGLNSETFLVLWAKKNLITIASSVLKISRIKPSEIQQLLFEYDDSLAEHIRASSTTMMNFNPLFEQVIYQHLHLEPKLFIT